LTVEVGPHRVVPFVKGRFARADSRAPGQPSDSCYRRHPGEFL